jgi:hypothetical protein
LNDDLEHGAFGHRPRDAREPPFRLPDARTLGRRLAVMRSRYKLSVADVADAAGLRHHLIEEFEEYGAVSGETLIWLIEVLCSGDHVGDAFVRPNFRDRDDLLSRGETASNVVPFRR